MSKRSDLVVACMLGNRWKNSTVVAGATVSCASPAPTDGQSRPHLETLWYSIKNFVGAGGAAATVAVQVRSSSENGTLFASVEHLVPASTTANVSISNMQIAGKRGARLMVTTSTFIASLTASVNAMGWIEDTNG